MMDKAENLSTEYYRTVVIVL